MAPPIKSQRIFHKSKIKTMHIAIGDPEGHKRRMDKADALVAELSSPYQEVNGELVENQEVKVLTCNMGDVSDWGTAPLSGYDWADEQSFSIAGNRDLNYLRGYELDPNYINFVYNALKAISEDSESYANFYEVQNNNKVLKKGDAWLAAAEASDLRYQVPNTNPIVTLPLPPIDGTPTGMDFYTWVQKELRLFGQREGHGPLTFENLTNENKQVLYLRHMNQCSRGAPDAFMHLAIDLAAKAAVDRNEDKKTVTQIKETGLKLYHELKKIDKELRADPPTKIAEDYITVYKTLRDHLNVAFGTVQGALTGSETTGNPLHCGGSFELEVVKFFQNPKPVIEFLKKAKIAHIVGEPRAKNQVVFMHAGFQTLNDFSLPDGIKPAKTIEEYINRYEKIRDKFFALYDRKHPTIGAASASASASMVDLDRSINVDGVMAAAKGPLDAQEEAEFMVLARGFSLMALPNTSLAGATFKEPLLAHMKGNTASSKIAAKIDENALKSITSQFKAMVNGHSPVYQLWLQRLKLAQAAPAPAAEGIQEAQTNAETDGEFIRVGVDLTYNITEDAATVAAVYEHDDGAMTYCAHVKDKDGTRHDLELGTYAANGDRIWPEDSMQIALQHVYGQNVKIKDKQFEKFWELNLQDPTLNPSIKEIMDQIESVPEVVISGENREAVLKRVKDDLKTKFWQIQFANDPESKTPAISLTSTGGPLTVVAGQPSVFFKFRTNFTLDATLSLVDDPTRESIMEVVGNTVTDLQNRRVVAAALFKAAVAKATTPEQIEAAVLKYKAGINERQNPLWDTFWGKTQTTTWGDHLVAARSKALDLISKQRTTQVTDMNSAAGYLGVLNVYRNLTVISEHPDNHRSEGAFGRTKGQREIDAMKDELITTYKIKTQN